ARHRNGAGAGIAGAELRDPDALRHGRPGEGCAGRNGTARACLHAVWRTAARDGVSGASAAGEHGERVVPAGRFQRGSAGGGAAARSGGGRALAEKTLTTESQRTRSGKRQRERKRNLSTFFCLLCVLCDSVVNAFFSSP